ncbi:MAG TPA: hypothetical protein VHB73_02250, partial [Alphaproteobacteria bacterium]|nr:hypothetical protein [Alphaproteobacteria bacterium]
MTNAAAHDTHLSSQQITRALFAPAGSEPKASPGLVAFFRGLVTVQSYLIGILIGLALLASVTFGVQNNYHLIVLDHDGFPQKVQPLYGFDEPNLTHTAILNMALHLATQV